MKMTRNDVFEMRKRNFDAKRSTPIIKKKSAITGALIGGGVHPAKMGKGRRNGKPTITLAPMPWDDQSADK